MQALRVTFLGESWHEFWNRNNRANRLTPGHLRPRGIVYLAPRGLRRSVWLCKGRTSGPYLGPRVGADRPIGAILRTRFLGGFAPTFSEAL